jgi:hypothetical protein
VNIKVDTVPHLDSTQHNLLNKTKVKHLTSGIPISFIPVLLSHTNNNAYRISTIQV